MHMHSQYFDFIQNHLMNKHKTLATCSKYLFFLYEYVYVENQKNAIFPKDTICMVSLYHCHPIMLILHHNYKSSTVNLLSFAVFCRSRAEHKKIDWEGSVGASLEEEIVCIEFYLHRGNQIAGSQDKHCTGHITQKNHTHLSTCKLCKFCKPGNFKKNISGLSIYSSYHIWL